MHGRTVAAICHKSGRLRIRSHAIYSFASLRHGEHAFLDTGLCYAQRVSHRFCFRSVAKLQQLRRMPINSRLFHWC